MKTILNQTQAQRLKESLSAQLITDELRIEDICFALAPSDIGVQRNGGRLGARWAPKVILNSVKKLATCNPELRLNCVDVTHQTLEQENFPQMIEQEGQALQKCHIAQTLIHIGGGHDHIYPLLKSFAHQSICVINIDAHLDTRTDSEPHSGNPFRLFDQQTKKDFQLYQIGIHPFANSKTTQSPLTNGEMRTLYKNECSNREKLRSFLQLIENNLKPDTVIVFSLDCDAISSGELEAVSAPNHDGLSVELINELISFYKDLTLRRSQKSIWGIYEFNPLYDSVSSKGARTIAGLIYRMIF
ncbi:MAG: arginase family protein [Bacteriovoracaceae bacterium]|nr:arginase family protein [Bacteriovoracaceae bacterium]